MRADPEVMLLPSPQTRPTGVPVLLEEWHAACTLQLLDLHGRQQQRQPAFLAGNPMGNPMSKSPAIRHRRAVVTEQVAVFVPPVGASGTVTAQN